MDSNSENSWVSARLATLEPEWTPNPARARDLLDARLAAPRRSRMWAVCTVTAAVCLALLALPGSRATAQQLWDRFVLNRIDIVRVDLSRMPVSLHVTTNGLEESVANLEEAERKAGFRPSLPASGSEPSLTVLGPMEIEQTIRVGDLQAALARVGATDVQVPAEWDGVRFHFSLGPVVSAAYPDNVRILQMQPVQFSAPSGFDLERLAEAAFRSIGVSAWEAHTLGRRFAEHPAWLLDIPPEKLVNIQELNVAARAALLVEDLDAKGVVEKATVFRSTDERLYAVSSANRALSIKAAESLP